MRDLERAIELSETRPLVARQAYTQRAVLYRIAGDDERARADFERGARLGSALAKREAVKMNPYAQLCNQMVTEALRPWTGGAAGATQQ